MSNYHYPQPYQSAIREEDNRSHQQLGNQNSPIAELNNHCPQLNNLNNDQEINDLMTHLHRLNDQLRYIGVRTINSMCQCSAEHIHETIELVHDLISLKDKEREKCKQIGKLLQKTQIQMKNRENKVESLSGHLEQLGKEKQYLCEKIKIAQRQYKQKEERHIKDKETLLKDKRNLQIRDHTMKNDFRKMELKIKGLQTKLQKYIEKGEKYEYRNLFQIYGTSKKTQKTNYQIEFEQSVVKSIEEKQRRLDEQNNILRQQIKFMFQKLQNICSKFIKDYPEMLLKKDIIDLPIQFSGRYRELIQKYLQIIEHKLKQVNYLQQHSDRNGNSQQDINTLNKKLSKMMDNFSQCQQIVQIQKGIMKTAFQISLERQQREKFSLKTLENINHILNQSDSLTHQRLNFKQQLSKDNQISNYIHDTTEQDSLLFQKTKFLQNQLHTLNRIQLQKQDCLTNEIH